jgi:TonB family protein
MGRPDRPNVRKMYASKGPKDAVPMLARNFDPDLSARNAGILGMAQLEAGHFLASPHGGAFAIGNDDEDLWGNIQGDAIGESGGAAGLGLVGTGRGGGGEGEGTVGLTGVGTIGQSGNNGDRLGYGNRNGRDSGTAFDGRKSKKPIIRMPAGDFHGVLDKELIRRVVRAHLNEVRGCYDQGLARDPNLRGRVEIQFAIGPTGAVSSSVVSETSVDDEQVGRCIAKAVRRWRFPTNAIGGSAMVSYPFQLQTGG